jgi:hypothetical protein
LEQRKKNHNVPSLEMKNKKCHVSSDRLSTYTCLSLHRMLQLSHQPIKRYIWYLKALKSHTKKKVKIEFWSTSKLACAHLVNNKKRQWRQSKLNQTLQGYQVQIQSCYNKEQFYQKFILPSGLTHI